ncbi:MAG: tyrosine-type recombinase/integrase [Janthinobacterium lividum]
MSQLSLSTLTTDYLNALRHERGCAQTTCFTYASWLRHFRKWLGENGHDAEDMAAFSAPVLRAYFYALSSRELRPRSIRSAFNPLRGFGEFLVSHHLLPDNPAKAITMPKKDAARRLTISPAEVAALLDGVERLHPPRRTVLARAIIYTFVFTGVRFQEALDLKIGDVSVSGGTVLVASGKGSKSRQLYPPQLCMDALRQWLAVRGECRHDWLWAENRGRRVGEMGVRDLLEEVKAIAGLRDHDNIKPHSLRHAFATRMMANGASLKTIQSSLGHSQLQTTAIYIHAEEHETRKMAEFAAMTPSHTTPQPNPMPSPRHALSVDYHRQRRQRPR